MQPQKQNAHVGIVLAAGQSTRFGSDKRRALLREGQTLLHATLSLAQRHFGHVIVVLGPKDKSLPLEIPEAITIVYAPETQAGLGTSISSAFQHLLETNREAQTAAVLLGDMPWIQWDTVERLKQNATASTIVRPLYHSQVGHPVFFGKTFWKELSELSGDDGAKSVVQRHREKCELIEVDDVGVLKDVDRPGDLRR
ncbi:nucleotidyltransferase family protein [Marinimicrobium agarilyticum]|uniref:nucleotidyltransferase family protein n=1 Tax=Marinimicrobium agarilyticum TaxID=306546 RepID=UPI0004835B7A|nr:nucleotidyltransferase family protein [Marinimicrobium agarilyticum]